MPKVSWMEEISLGLSQAYLIRAREGCILVDAGVPGQANRILRRLRSQGWGDLKLIYLTHAHIDHAGSAAALREMTGAAIAIHRSDAEALLLGETRLGSLRADRRLIQPFVPDLENLLKSNGVLADILFNDGDDLTEYGLAAKIFHTPGHTLGSSSLVHEDGLAFVGDLASNTVKPHLQRYYAEDWSLLRESVTRLQGFGLKRVYGGHGRGFLTGDVFNMLTL